MSGCLDTSGHTRDVAVSGQYAYVADGANGLRIIDIGTPSAPALVGELATADQHGGDACVVELMGHDYVCVGDLDATS
ncbi:MAG: hypothetical protein KKB50_17910, partial [Planctomycetes bacterium]|nr:hypothetical protein [Planctomycetota bacterium]